MKIKRNLLIINEKSNFINEITRNLERRGFSCRYALDREDIKPAIYDKKPNAILISDFGKKLDVLETLRSIRYNPETRNIRLVVITKSTNEKLISDILAIGVRAVIPRSLSINETIRQFIFAVAGNHAEYKLNNVNHYSFDNRLNLEVPGKITTFSMDRIVVETPVYLRKGQKVSLNIPFCSSLGENKISAVVLSVSNQDLIHNLSQGCILKPSFSSLEIQKKINSWIQKNHAVTAQIRFPVFFALGEKKLRRQIIDHVPSSSFIIRFAWSKSTIFQEPVYFTPQIMFIDDSFINSSNLPEFIFLLEHLKNPIYIVVNCKTNREEVEKLLHSITTTHQIMFFNDLSLEKIQLILNDLLEKIHKSDEIQDVSRIHFPENHEHVNCSVLLNAELKDIRKNQLFFSSDHHICRFTHIKVNSPFLNEMSIFPAMIKLTDSFIKSRTNRVTKELRQEYQQKYFYEGFFVCYPEKKRIHLHAFQREKITNMYEDAFLTKSKKVESKDESKAVSSVDYKDIDAKMITDYAELTEIIDKIDKVDKIDKIDQDQSKEKKEKGEKSFKDTGDIGNEYIIKTMSSRASEAKATQYIEEPTYKNWFSKYHFSVWNIIKILLIIFSILILLLVFNTYILPLLQRHQGKAASRFTESFRSYIDMHKRPKEKEIKEDNKKLINPFKSKLR